MTTTASNISNTPITVKPRRMKFSYDSIEESRFFDNNLLKSAYIAALSATFPAGEAEFIASVRAYRDKISDPEMLEQIKGFIGQEAHHSHQHKQFNKTLSSLGFDIPRLEKVFEKDLAWSLKRKTFKHRLAFTVAFEHQTALLAHAFLSEPEMLRGMPEEIAKLLRWHAVEEIEHKSVAFDLYMMCEGDKQLLNKAQRVGTRLFSLRMIKYMSLLLIWARKAPSRAEWAGFYRFLFGKTGLITMVRQPYRDYFSDDFHPWQHKNQALVNQWEAQQA